jgi:hypothetical protein
VSHFTEEQLKELETVFGIKRGKTLPVRDGVVTKESMVWWRCSDGPQHVLAGSETHWENIHDFPNAYQLAEPDVKIQYLD